jgi:putative tricarboxylic transport membrane protein
MMSKPGPGFMPFWSGVLIGILGALLLVQELLSDRRKKGTNQRDQVNWKSILLTLIFLLAYILSLEHVGFIIGTILFVGIILKIIEKKGWILSGFVALALALASYCLFTVWLQVNLGKGFLGF